MNGTTSDGKDLLCSSANHYDDYFGNIVCGELKTAEGVETTAHSYEWSPRLGNGECTAVWDNAANCVYECEQTGNEIPQGRYSRGFSINTASRVLRSAPTNVGGFYCNRATLKID